VSDPLALQVHNMRSIDSFPALQFYTYGNRYRSWDFSHSQGNLTIPKPVLAIYPTRDPVADWLVAAELVGAPKFLPYLTTKVIATAHWCHMERPAEFNAIVEEWLDDLDSKLLEAELGEEKKVARVNEEIKEEETEKKKRTGDEL
jgi:soluble epoxide hydrolase / lipid-phosphate phosphatase